MTDYPKCCSDGTPCQFADRISELEARHKQLVKLNEDTLDDLRILQRKYDALVEKINNLPRFVMKLSPPLMDKPQRIEWYPHKDGGWIANHQLRALLKNDDD